MTRTLAILAALTLSACACGEPGRCQLAPPPGAQSYTPQPAYVIPPTCPAGFLGGQMLAQHQCLPAPYRMPEPQQMHQTYCMPTGYGSFSCIGS